MLNHLPKELIPYWNYDFVDGNEPRDASAGAISACGLLEMASMMDDSDPDKVIFESAATKSHAVPHTAIGGIWRFAWVYRPLSTAAFACRKVLAR